MTDEDLELLDFQNGWWRHGGAKEAAIAERFGLSAVRFYQRLNTLADDPEALAARPLVVRRLQRLRATRRRRVS